jgi:hypothetical protein
MDRPKYSGVHWHARDRKWLVKFRHHGRDLNVARCDDPEDGAWISDIARQLVFGVNEANWPVTAGTKNGIPPRHSVPRAMIVCKLLDLQALSHAKMRERLSELDAKLAGAVS